MITAAVPLFTVERSAADPDAWAAFVVTPAGGAGPRASPFTDRDAAEAWARAHGRFADPVLEAA